VPTCVISTTLAQLSSPAKALGAARSLLGPGVDEADLATATKELTSVGGKLLVFGWVLQLWPILQLGWGGTADVVHSLLTGGTSTLIGLHLGAVQRPATPACSAAALFAAAVSGQHFSTDPSQYPPGEGPGASDPVCDGSWAIALVSHPHVGDTDGFTLFRAEGGQWVFADGVGGEPADCILTQLGVPASIAKVLWPPGHSAPASYCSQTGQ
jgi:hypothetical protein